MQTHICILKMSVCCCQQTCFIFACYGCTCKFPSSSINYLLLHNQYVPFPKTIHFRPYITLLSQKSINTVMSPYTNVFAQFFLLILSITCLSPFYFLNLQLPPSSFAQTLLLLTPDPAFAHSMQEKEQQLHIFCCSVSLSHLSDTEAPSAPFAKETASPKGSVQ